ncbi:F2E2.21 [Arabidopsis thaliana]|uniref:F2E2.21 n=1 Tax=Arabidopsis thaliana TaxID=3702 RepID=Q9LM45_ARATH|nr:F2E2.21 [Arabidopsis thaliana]
MGAGNGETPKPTQISISKDQFLAWKRQKDAELLAKQAEAARKRQEDIASGRVPMNGLKIVHRVDEKDNKLCAMMYHEDYLAIKLIKVSVFDA